MSIIIPANTLAAGGGYDVDNSLRFGSNTYLTATFGSSPTLATKCTFSMWFKKSTTGALQQLMSSNNNAVSIVINSNDTIAFYNNSGDVSGQLLGPRLYRDTSAWMHFVFATDTTQGTASNRLKVYINGVLETSFNNTGYPEQNVASAFGTNGTDMKIGTRTQNDRIFEGYIAETAFVDGQALAADSFGEFDDSGNWRAIDISDLTFGNNGFYLEHKGTGTSANSSGIGADTSGNDLHFAVTNFTAVDQSTDTCTNNFSTLNPLGNDTGNGVFTEGNLVMTTSSNAHTGRGMSTIRPANGKWYAECKVLDSDRFVAGFMNGNETYGAQGGDDTNSIIVFYTRGSYFNGNGEDNYLGATLSDDDIMMFAMDLDNNIAWMGVNGTWAQSATASEIANGTADNSLTTFASASNAVAVGFCGIFIEDDSGSEKMSGSMNFGSPAFAISSSNADGNGFGNFEYAVPSGYFALCTKNLAEHG